MTRVWRIAGVAMVALALNAQASLIMSAYMSGNFGTYGQTFDSLANTGTSNPWTDDSTIAGWFAERYVGGPLATYRADNGAANAGALYSYGAVGSTERALGTLGSGTPLVLTFGLQLTNNTTQTAYNFALSYTGEQWRRGTNSPPNVTDTLKFWYAVSSAELTGFSWTNDILWTAYSPLDFVSPNAKLLTIAGGGEALDGNVASNQVAFANVAITGLSVAPGQFVAIRWTDPNDFGTDQGMAVDGLTMTWEVPEPTTMGLGLLAAVVAGLARRRRMAG